MKKLFLLLVLVFVNNFLFAQKALPNISLKNFQGTSVSITENFNEKDKIYLFSFWATWCAPCLQELDSFNESYDLWKSKLNIEIVAVSVDDSRTIKRVRPLVNGKGWEFTILFDSNNEFKRNLGFATIPYLVVVKNNHIVFVQSGYAPGGEEELFNELEKL
jgi:peroxiredoxin